MGMIGANGGLVGARRVPSLGGASGIWTPNEQVLSRRENAWPRRDGYRYYRFDQLAVTNLLEISEWVLVQNGAYITGGTWTVSGSGLSQFNAARMADNVLNVRAFQVFNTVASGDFVQYDHGAEVSVSGFRYCSYFESDSRHLTGFRIRGSFDGTTYYTIATRSGLSNPFAADGQLSAEITFP